MIRIDIGDDFSKWIKYQKATPLMHDGHRELVKILDLIYNDYMLK